MKDKQANRRIRLLLAIFVLVFAGTLARAVWLQGVQASSLGKMAERQHHESIVIPAGRGTIYDAAGVQLQPVRQLSRARLEDLEGIPPQLRGEIDHVNN